MNFNKIVSDLGVGYINCSESQSQCTRKEADKRRGCPNCQYTKEYNLFKKNLELDLTKADCTRADARKWPMSYLLKLVVEVGYQASLYEKAGPDWTIVTSILVGVYRDEVGKLKTIENYKLIEESKAAQQNREYDDSED